MSVCLKEKEKLRFVSLDFRGKVHCRINEFRISFIIERVIVGTGASLGLAPLKPQRGRTE